MHDHDECDHKFKYCEKCDVVYCTKCEREWGGHKHTQWIYTPYTPYTYYPSTIGGSDINSGRTYNDNVTICSHS